MRYNLNHEKPLPGYKTPNPNFPKQLRAFLLQSKHEKHQQFQDIDQYLVEQFLHLFEIWNINRFIDYTKEFINQVRSVILRLEVAEKKTFECLKEEYICLIYEGKIQRIQKENLCKRTSKCGFQSSALMGHFNSRSSHQTLHNIQLKEFEKSIIIDRSQRMSITNGNLWNEMISLPKRKTKMEQKTSIEYSLVFFDQTQPKIQDQFLHRNQNPNAFQHRLKEQHTIEEQNHYGPIQKYSNQYGMELIQTLQDEIYQCMTPVKCIKVLKWSYDHLVQYVYKYQTERLIKFLSTNLCISEHDIKFHQVYNKIGFHFYPKRQSQHSNLYIGLDEGGLYILRKGAVELKYQCEPTSGKGENNSSKLVTGSRSNPNLAQHVNRPQTKYKKVVLNQGAIICPELENHSFFIQSLEEVVLLEIDHNLLGVLKSQLKDNWWNEKLKSSYEKVKVDRKLYMKDEEICQKEEFRELKMNNVSIESKSRMFRSSNKQKSRFRAQPKKFDENENFISQKQETQINSQDKENNELDFNPEEYKQFISFLPYEIMIKSKQKISMKLKEKSKIKNVASKVLNYLKKNQKGLSSAKSKERVLALKMKNIASKEINLKDLESLQDNINNDEAKKEFHRSLKGNWFKEEIDFSSDPTVKENSLPRNSVTQKKIRKNPLLAQNKAGKYKSSIQIGEFVNKIDRPNKRLTVDVNQLKPSQSDEKKVAGGVQDQSSDEEYLCKDDTGLINKFIQNTHNYQKQLSYLINASKLEETQLKQQKRLKKHKTQGIVLGYSQHLIKDMRKRASCQNKKSVFSNISNKENQKLLYFQSKSVSFDENKVFKNGNQGNKNQGNLQKVTEKNCEDFSTLLTGMVGKKVEIHDSSELFAGWNEGRELKNGKEGQDVSLSNSIFLRKYSNKGFQPSKPKYNNNHSSLDHRRGSLNLRKQPCMQNEFGKEKLQRPMSGQLHIETVHQQCRSLFFNQWIDSSSEIDSEKLQTSDLAVGKYNFCDRNTSTGDKKIWKKLKSGKIVKKSLKYYIKKCNVNSFQQTVDNKTTIA